MAYDWMMALAGGLLIGFAASLLLVGNGRIAGISGMLGNLTKGTKPNSESVLFVAGLFTAPLAYGLFYRFPEVEITSNLPVLIIGGLAVGVGTQLGNGCTSGHGICGNARLSKRSIIATITFIATGVLTVAVMG